MRNFFFITMLLYSSLCGGLKAHVCNNPDHKHSDGYPISPVPFTSVKVTDAFWGQRLNASREVTIPLAFSKCEEAGRYENFVKAANPSESYKVKVYRSMIRTFTKPSKVPVFYCKLTQTSNWNNT